MSKGKKKSNFTSPLPPFWLPLVSDLQPAVTWSQLGLSQVQAQVLLWSPESVRVKGDSASETEVMQTQHRFYLKKMKTAAHNNGFPYNSLLRTLNKLPMGDAALQIVECPSGRPWAIQASLTAAKEGSALRSLGFCVWMHGCSTISKLSSCWLKRTSLLIVAVESVLCH